MENESRTGTRRQRGTLKGSTDRGKRPNLRNVEPRSPPPTAISSSLPRAPPHPRPSSRAFPRSGRAPETSSFLLFLLRLAFSRIPLTDACIRLPESPCALSRLLCTLYVCTPIGPSVQPPRKSGAFHSTRLGPRISQGSLLIGRAAKDPLTYRLGMYWLCSPLPRPIA
jgi:hypothetical protein